MEVLGFELLVVVVIPHRGVLSPKIILDRKALWKKAELKSQGLLYLVRLQLAHRNKSSSDEMNKLNFK